MDIELDMKMNEIYSISQKLDWTQLYLNNHVSNEDVGDPLVLTQVIVNWPIQFRSQKCVCQFKEATLHVDKTCEVPRYWWPIGTLISKWDKLHTWIDKHTFENEIELVNSQWPN
jgi:hypothetical protein